ncbi:MAG: peptidoglycan-binding domain-containing protein [Betaproteobacteria bacterium]
MKLKLVTTLIAGLFAASAYAAGEPAKQSRSQAGQDRSASQGMQRPQQDGMSQTEQHQRAGGMSSDTVRKAQQALKDKGHDPGPVDGIMGPQTQAAVKKFQESQANMKGTGQLNQQTLSALGVEGGAGTGSAAGSQRGASAPPAAGGSPAPSAGGKQPDPQKSR